MSVQYASAQAVLPVSLDCVNIINNGITRIDWNADLSNCNNFESYDIYVAPSNSDTYTLVAQILDQSEMFYVDSLSFNLGSGFLHYYIVTNCDGKTSEPSDTVDNERPIFPEIQYVTVDGEDVQIKWNSSISPEAEAYIIHHFTDNGFVKIDTVSSVNNTYTHTGATTNPQNNPERYTISTVDACLEEGAQNTLPSETIFLRASNTTCSNDVFLDWSPYIGWPADKNISSYELYGSYNGGNMQMLQNFDKDQDRFSFSNDSINVNELCFEIRAIRAVDLVSSSSNRVCVNLMASSGNQPDYIYLRNVSILDDSSVHLEYYIDNSVNFDLVRYLSGSSVDKLSVIETLNGNTIQNFNIYNDVSSDSRNRILNYQVEVEDSCGNRHASKFARTIHLSGKPDGANNNYLQWTGFGILNGNVTGYTVYRQDLYGDFNQVGTTAALDVQFEESVQDIQPNENGKICYKVIAEYDIDFPELNLTETLTSASNVVCVTQPGRIKAPNAFAPNGVNKIFKPVVVNIDFDNYNMVLMNRWGGVVFETSNPTEGWDGSYKGRDAPEGVYAYYISYSGFDKILKEKKGAVLLIR